VKVCPVCREENAFRARFCQGCGTLLPAVATRSTRRTVTVVFSDISGSTRLTQRLDPESFRSVMTRYFDEMRAVLERHGGTVEKFIGDAVMAVFGIPELHEDDALRAVRAAVEMKNALEDVNEELVRRWGTPLAVRTGLNTGEVVTGDPARGQSLVTGDAVNLAARLESAASPGEILIGKDTHALVKDAVRAEPLEPLSLKGIGQPVAAFRLLEVIPGAAGRARRLDSPLVGRDDELGVLESAFRSCVADAACRIVTILGAVGVGKSRLALELERVVEPGPLVLTGRCLSYGECNTFRPLAQAVRTAVGVGDEDSPGTARKQIADFLEDEPGADAIADRVAQLIGFADSPAAATENFDAVVQLFEALARRRPLVLVFDDIHWAEPTFLALLRHVNDRSRGVPIFLLCVARSELLDRYPEWASERTVALEPLSDAECRRLVEFVLGPGNPSRDVQDRIVSTAGGNPLFLEEMLAMLIDEGLLVDEEGRYILRIDPADIRVPPTIQAVLAARLDRLPPDERRVIEIASVAGDLFHEDEIAAVASGEDGLRSGEILSALVAKEFVRAETGSFSKTGAYRFHHSLIRDVAYEQIPKLERARLHEILATWLEGGRRAWSRWLQEMMAYHLERAYWYRVELAPLDGAAAAVARRASTELASAGRKAYAARDIPPAASLMRRAVAIYPDGDIDRLELLPILAEALVELEEFDEAHALATEAIETARARGHRAVESHALIVLLKLPKKPGFSLSLGYGIGGEGTVRRRRDP
jgi:class 3 adenylate cyclase